MEAKSLIILLTALSCLLFTNALHADCGSCGPGDDHSHDKKHVEQPEFADIDHASLKEKMAKGTVTLLDVNGTASYEKGHIPGAINFEALSKDELADQLPEDKDSLIVAYCGNPRCKAYQAGAKAARELGYTHVMHYSAGIQGWKKAGEAVEKM